MLFFNQAPLRIDRAQGQYMYDDEGRRFIDCINNVAHGRLIQDTFVTWYGTIRPDPQSYKLKLTENNNGAHT